MVQRMQRQPSTTNDVEQGQSRAAVLGDLERVTPRLVGKPALLQRLPARIRRDDTRGGAVVAAAYHLVAAFGGDPGVIELAQTRRPTKLFVVENKRFIHESQITLALWIITYKSIAWMSINWGASVE
ncbi:MAG: hypothetical protein ABI881_10515 [Betaproteobacteria bacterium]